MKIAHGCQRQRQWISSAGFGFLLLGLVLLGITQWGESSPIPAVKISALSNNIVVISVTNGTNNEFYEIYTRNFLESNYPWSLTVTGSVGVTNFTIANGTRQIRFFKAESGNDKDGDGILNLQDADPLSSGVSNVLMITIQSPTNGMNIQ